VVVESFSGVDASMLTGEAMPVEVGPADDVVGASVYVRGRIVLRTNKVSSHVQQFA